jgi:ATP-binding cassette subfamily B protein
MVLQDTRLFEGTIAENLLYGKPTATPAELKQAIKSAYLDHVIQSLPKGLETPI